MVKVLENKLVDLDLMPGETQIQAQRQLRAQLQDASGQLGAAGPEVQKAIDGATGQATDQAQNAAGQLQGMQIPKEMLPDNLSDEQKAQARSVAGTVLDGGGNVIGGLAGTVGGVLKGVGDTAGNTVFALGSGLGNTGLGAVSGLAQTAKAPFQGSTKSDGNVETKAEEGKMGGAFADTDDAQDSKSATKASESGK